MSDHDFGHHAAGDPLPDRLKQYLTEMARRELETLRADLEVRLVALETALARPDQHDSIETLVFDLARAATVEAEAAASRAMLAAQIEAQERSGTADALKDLESERSVVQALRAEIEQLRSWSDGELVRIRGEQDGLADQLTAAQRDLAAAQRDLAAAQQEAKDARRMADARAAELASARDAAGAAQVEAAARVKTLEAKIKTLEARAADAERVRREAVARADAADVLARETVARASNAEAWGKDAESRLRAAEARAAQDEARIREVDARARELEARAAQDAARIRELDARARELEARVAQEATRAAESEARASEMQARARELEQHARALETRAPEDEARVRDFEARARDAEARAAGAEKERAALAAEVAALKQTLARQEEQAAGRQGDAARIEEYERRLAVADERIRMLELQLFQRDRPEPGVADEELAGMLTSGSKVPFKPTRIASRYSFAGGVNVEINGSLGALIDLSTTGAQVLSPGPIDEGTEVELRLMSDEIPTACRGTVVWTRIEPKSPRQPLRYRLGIHFTNVDVGAVEAFIIRYAAT